MKKVKLTQSLVDRIEHIIHASKNGLILTDQGLSRKELRALERHGIIESKLFKHRKKGQIIRGWSLVGGGLVKKTLDSNENSD